MLFLDKIVPSERFFSKNLSPLVTFNHDITCCLNFQKNAQKHNFHMELRNFEVMKQILVCRQAAWKHAKEGKISHLNCDIKYKGTADQPVNKQLVILLKSLFCCRKRQSSIYRSFHRFCWELYESLYHTTKCKLEILWNDSYLKVDGTLL